MSRSTQWIGLTRLGWAFVKDLKTLPSDKNIEGMFEETIPLGKWEGPTLYNKNTVIREVVQASPWSSGPMIFTSLTIEYYQDDKVVTTANCFQWIEDPTLTTEFDYKTGRFWI